MLVSIDAAKRNRLAVDVQPAVDDRDVSEADALSYGLNRFAVGADQFQEQRVEVRRLSSPRLDIEVPDRYGYVRQRVRVALNEDPVAIIERVGEFHCAGFPGDPDSDVEFSGFESIIQARSNEIVVDTGLWLGKQFDGALEPGHGPEVLILEVAARRPLHHHGRKRVPAGNHKVGHVELGGEFRVLAVTDALAVDPDIQPRVGGAEPEYDPPVLPVFRHAERRAIQPGRVVFCGDQRLVERKHVVRIDIARYAKALPFPVTGNDDGAPRGGVEIRCHEICRNVAGCVCQVELPLTVQ